MVGAGASSSSPRRPRSSPAAAVPVLRRAVLAVSVLDDVDLEPRASGVRLPGLHPVTVRWSVLWSVLDGADPAGPTGRHRLRTWLRLRRLVADLGEEAAGVLAEAARALALPHPHPDHLGPQWVRETLLGGDVHVGIGVVGLLDDVDEVVALHPTLAAAAGADPATWWPRVRGHADAMGALAAHRLARDEGARRQSVLRPVGGCEVPTLLASAVLRRYLAGSDGSGMRALAVPMRTRGWYDLARIDPAFVGAAWSATPEEKRAFCRPLLVTADEVRLAVPAGDPVTPVLADPAGREPHLRDVRYH